MCYCTNIRDSTKFEVMFPQVTKQKFSKNSQKPHLFQFFSQITTSLHDPSVLYQRHSPCRMILYSIEMQNSPASRRCSNKITNSLLISSTNRHFCHTIQQCMVANAAEKRTVKHWMCCERMYAIHTHTAYTLYLYICTYTNMCYVYEYRR